jgi:hypothetical protein
VDIDHGAVVIEIWTVTSEFGIETIERFCQQICRVPCEDIDQL